MSLVRQVGVWLMHEERHGRVWFSKCANSGSMLGVKTKQIGRQMDEGTFMAASWTFARPGSECKLARGRDDQCVCIFGLRM